MGIIQVIMMLQVLLAVFAATAVSAQKEANSLPVKSWLSTVESASIDGKGQVLKQCTMFESTNPVKVGDGTCAAGDCSNCDNYCASHNMNNYCCDGEDAPVGKVQCCCLASAGACSTAGCNHQDCS